MKKTGSGWTFEEALGHALRAFDEEGFSGSAQVYSHEVELKVPDLNYPLVGVDGRVYQKPWHVVTLEATP